MSLLRQGDLSPWNSMLIVDLAEERGSEVLTEAEKGWDDRDTVDQLIVLSWLKRNHIVEGK